MVLADFGPRLEEDPRLVCVFQIWKFVRLEYIVHILGFYVFFSDFKNDLSICILSYSSLVDELIRNKNMSPITIGHSECTKTIGIKSRITSTVIKRDAFLFFFFLLFIEIRSAENRRTPPIPDEWWHVF